METTPLEHIISHWASSQTVFEKKAPQKSCHEGHKNKRESFSGSVSGKTE